MRLLFALALLMALLTGCIVAVPGHLYPVQGPLATQDTRPIYVVRISGVLDSGTLSATLGGGETCSGGWSRVSQSDPNASRMATAWDRIYGPGFFTANVLGAAAFAQAQLTCNQGTTVDLQFYLQIPGRLQTARGVAEDSRGNLFKLTF